MIIIILVNALFTKLNNPIVVDATASGDSGTERLPGDLMSVGGGLDSPAPPNLAELSGRRRPAGTASVRPCVCECARHISSTRHRLSWICQGTHLPLSSPLRKQPIVHGYFILHGSTRHKFDFFSQVTLKKTILGLPVCLSKKKLYSSRLYFLQGPVVMIYIVTR